MWRPSSWDISDSVLYAPVFIITAPICGQHMPQINCLPLCTDNSSCADDEQHDQESQNKHISHFLLTRLWYMLRMASTRVGLICSSTRRCDARSYTMMREKLPAGLQTRMLDSGCGLSNMPLPTVQVVPADAQKAGPSQL